MGPDGNLWFAGLVNDRIGRIEPGCPSAPGTTGSSTTTPTASTTTAPTTTGGGPSSTLAPGATTTAPTTTPTTVSTAGASTVPTATDLVRTGAALRQTTGLALLLVTLGTALVVANRRPARRRR